MYLSLEIIYSFVSILSLVCIITQAVFGELIESSEYHDLSQILTVYIQSRFLSNEDITERYKHPTIAGHFGEGTYTVLSPLSFPLSLPLL